MKKMIILIVLGFVISGFGQELDTFYVHTAADYLYFNGVFYRISDDTLFYDNSIPLNITLEMIPDSLKELIIDKFWKKSEFEVGALRIDIGESYYYHRLYQWIRDKTTKREKKARRNLYW